MGLEHPLHVAPLELVAQALAGEGQGDPLVEQARDEVAAPGTGDARA